MSKVRMPRHKVVQPANKAYRLIALTRGQNAIVDAADFEYLDQWNWFAYWNPSTRSFYAVRNGQMVAGEPRKYFYMHRVVMGNPDGKFEVDHIDFDGLNNRRSNLRLATHGMNVRYKKIQRNNTSGFKGVTYSKQINRWLAQATFENEHFHLGSFKTREAAAIAYDFFAAANFGSFARLNSQEHPNL